MAQQRDLFGCVFIIMGNDSRVARSVEGVTECVSYLRSGSASFKHDLMSKLGGGTEVMEINPEL